jgi:hypothetical protein
MTFEFKVWVKNKIINDFYTQRRFAVDLNYQPVCFIQSHIIINNKEDVKCTLITFFDGTKKIAVEQYTSFINKYNNFVDEITANNLPNVN